MRALTLKQATGIEAALLGEVPNTIAAPGEVLVRVRAAALNHRELWIVEGQYPAMTLPATLGADGAGIVEFVGVGVDPAWIGRPVILYPGIGWGDDPLFPAASFGLLGMPGPGTIAEYISVDAGAIAHMPKHLDFAQAAALPLGGLTAWRMLRTKARLRRGERVLVTGAGGGVAGFAIAFAVAMGAEVWVTSGSEETIARAMAMGAAGGVNYRDEGWPKTMKGLPPINVVIDGAPAGGYAAYGRSLAMGARVVVYGSTGGNGFTVNAAELFLKNLSVMGSNVGNRMEFDDMLEFVVTHRLVPVIERRFTFEDSAAALAYLSAHHGFGKIVIEMEEPA